MGASNGTVLGLVKIHDSGLPNDRWNLVMVAEGYQASEQAQFQQDAQELLDQLLATAPFDEDETACAINVYRLDVESDESGADDPDCDGAGNNTTADTYFDATFCADGVIRRLLGGNSTLVQDTVDAIFPLWHQIVVIVNSPLRGGSGGAIAWTSTGGFDWKDVFIHELGHAAFGLADEYDYYTGAPDEEGQDNYPGGEPGQPNVTAEPDPALVKWSALVTAGPASPTMDNPDCGEPNNGPSPAPAGTVGTFEGAFYYHCDAYRPEYACMMRTTGTAFCAVCQDVIRQFYAAYATPATSGAVLLTTPTVTFNDVPEDVTTQRSATFSVDSCVAVTFQVTAAPSAPFELVSPATLVAYPSGPAPWEARVWFRYSCDSAGTSHNDQATIRCLETNETFIVNLTGNCVTRPSAAIQLVFDQSGSMLDMTDEGRTKVQVLRDSANVLVDLLYDDNGIGLNAYDHDPHPILDVQTAGEPGAGMGRDDVAAQIVTFNANPAGFTAIGDGIALAKDKLDAAGSFDVKAMIVLTDGIETADLRVADVADTVVNQRVFAIGMGTSSQIQPATLNALTNGTGGYLLMTGNLSADDTFLLAKYYLQILAGVTNNDIILDPEGYIRPGDVVRIPFDVVESDIEITGVVLSKFPPAFVFALETPDGQIIDQSVAATEPTVTFRGTPRAVFIRASLPQIVGGASTHGGRWHLLMKIDRKLFSRYLHTLDNDVKAYQEAIAHGLKYSANVYTYSNLRLYGQALQDSYEPGATITVRARLTEYGVPFEGSATVTARLKRPDGVQQLLIMPAVDQGVYQAQITADIVGNYLFRIKATGRTTREEPFTREFLVTAPIWHGGDTPQTPQEDSNERLCRLLSCVLKSGAISAEALERLKKQGIDLELLRRCLCRPSQSTFTPAGPPDISGQLNRLRDCIDRLTLEASR